MKKSVISTAKSTAVIMLTFSQLGLVAVPAKAQTETGSTATEVVEVVEAESPRQIVKRASDFIANAQNLTINADIEFDAKLSPTLVTQYAGKLVANLSRPGKLFIDYEDGRESVKIWIDGAEVTYLDTLTGHFAKLEGAETVEATAGALFQAYGLVLPLTRLLVADAHSEIMNSGTQRTYLGKVKMGAGYAHHIAIHGGATDIQVWVDAGETPIIRKLVTVNRSLPFAPHYSATFTKFETSEQLADDLFTPVLPADAKESQLSRMK